MNAEEERHSQEAPLYSSVRRPLYDVYSHCTSGSPSSLAARARQVIDDQPMRRACGQVTSHKYGLLRSIDLMTHKLRGLFDFTPASSIEANL